MPPFFPMLTHPPVSGSRKIVPVLEGHQRPARTRWRRLLAETNRLAFQTLELLS